MRKITVEELKRYEKGGHRILAREGSSHCTMICPEGHRYKMTVVRLRSHGRKECPSCKESNKIEKWNDRLRESAKSKGFVLETGITKNMKEPIQVRCNLCSTKYPVMPKTLIYQDHKCLACLSENRLVSWERLESSCWNNGYVLEDWSEVFSYNQTVNVSCIKFGHKFQMNTSHLLREIGSQCRECRKMETFSRNKHVLEARGIELLGDFPGEGESNTTRPMRCMTCGYSWSGHVYYFSKLRRCVEACPECSGGSLRGFRGELPGTLYYLRVDAKEGALYKIGITNLTVRKRFCSTDLEKIKILSEVHFDEGWKARKLEEYYLKVFSEYLYKGPPILKSNGNSELLTKDIFGLDK